jgi:predicted nuclease of predicted toxin-antitoxin system
VKLDENLPASLVAVLAELGHDADTVLAEGLQGRSDHDVWHAAQAARRLLVTQDLDFSDVRQLPPGAHGGVLLLRLRAPGRRALAERLQAIFETYDVATWRGRIVVATEHRIRGRPSR